MKEHTTNGKFAVTSFPLCGSGSMIESTNQGWYSLTWISKDQIKFEQKLSLFDQIFGSAQISIHETFDLIF